MLESILDDVVKKYWGKTLNYTYEVYENSTVKLQVGHCYYYVKNYNDHKGLVNIEEFRILEELKVMEELREKKVSVQKILRNGEGKLYTIIQNQFIVVYEWIEGESISAVLNKELAYEMGKLVGEFHSKSDELVSKNSLKSYNKEWLIGENSWFKQFEYKGYILSEDYYLIEKFLLMVSQNMEEDKLCCIHGDLHLNNILVNVKGRLILIDFDEMGIGPVKLDLGILFLEMSSLKNSFEIKNSFLKGYNENYFCEGLEKGITEDQIEPFLVVACIVYLEWIFNLKKKRFIEKEKYVKQTLIFLIKLIKES